MMRRMLVGRQHELAACVEAFARRRPLAVVGEAGVGKTALVRVATRAHPQPTVEARAFATLSWMTYLPLREALGRDPLDADPAFVARTLETRLAQSLLLLDDLQWADPGTREVTSLVAGRVPVVATIRSDEPGSAALTNDLEEAGFMTMTLQPLSDEESDTLLRRLRPELPETARTAIRVRAGGNPLLLEELASGDVGESLERSLMARVHAHGAETRADLELLALAGRPLDAGVLRKADGVVATGLVVFASGSVSYRHPLLGELVAARVPDDRRRAFHARLARTSRDAGEAARHHALAGERDLAAARALEAVAAAFQPGERAEHLLVAASCVDGDQADGVRMQAARALADAGRFADAERVLDEVTSSADALRAESLLLRARGAVENNELDRARDLLEEGSSLAPDMTGGVGLELAVELFDLDLYGDDDTIASVLRSASTLRASVREGGASVARLVALVGQARWALGDRSGDADLDEALELARIAGDAPLECQIAERAINPLFHDGERHRALRLCREMVLRSREVRLTSWERRFRTRAAWMLMHGGRYRNAFDEAEALLLEPLEWERFLATYVAAQVSVDLGLFERTEQLVLELHEMGRGGPDRHRQALWVQAELFAWSGRPRDAVTVIDELLTLYPGSMFMRVTRSWALVDLALEADTPPPEGFDDVPLFAGAMLELEALKRLTTGRPNEAARLFAEAESRWRHHHARGRLRCAWAQGESLRRAGDTQAAVESLQRAERLAIAYEHRPLVARIRRSLRLQGARRSAPRGQAASGLSEREQELVRLAGNGLTNAEIAVRVGVSRSTVARTLRNARHKLGVQTRAQAAARAARAEPG